MYRDYPELIQTLALRAADVVDAEEGSSIPTRVKMAEMGDGSGRWFATVTTYDQTNDLEQEYRITAPAPADAPAWAQIHETMRVELRVGERYELVA